MRRTRIAIVLAAVTTAMSGCAANTPVVLGPPPPPQCRAEALPPPWVEVDPCAGEQVLLAAVRAVFTYRPAEQPDTSEAVRQAGALLEQRFAADAVSTSLVWGPVTPVRWQQWREAGVRVDARVQLGADDHPADTATSLARVVQVELVPSTNAPIVFPVYATVARTGPTTGWRLAGMRVRS
ncbi:hypothetical protein [Nocardia takedensis]|uniref:hypothetical protein n=1 Tax=Nocardia takedensis TaxID=259390 RepID=UPI0002F39482|nr:hypothetical protein [Nocardia takedensis]